MLLNQADGKEQRTAMHEACRVGVTANIRYKNINGLIFNIRWTDMRQ